MPKKHIINLTIECKTAKGDGTKIVCLNRDYVVRIAASDCGSFTSAPVKKLIIRHNKEYYESDIKEVTEDGQTYLQAILPPIDSKDYIDLGVCGKETDDPAVTPIYTSKSARYECDKSVLSGVVILRSEPMLSSLYITENNKKYTAGEHGADGFYEVDVHIPTKVEEKRTVDLVLSDGNQVVIPSYNNYTMTEVIIKKPVNLSPENVRSGVIIGGVVGIFAEDYDGTVEITDTITGQIEQ